MKTLININLDNLIYNFLYFKNNLLLNKKIFPVLKGNAYCTNVFEIANALLNLEEWQEKSFFVFSLKEAIELKTIFEDKIKNIYILGGIENGTEETFLKYKITPVINSLTQLLNCKNSIKNVALQFNTGMNRNGIDLNEIKKTKDILQKNQINVSLIMTHLAYASKKNHLITIQQLDNFNNIVKPNFQNIATSISATDGIFALDESNLGDIVRLGGGLYGFPENKNLKPVLYLEKINKNKKYNLVGIKYSINDIAGKFNTIPHEVQCKLACNNGKIEIISNNKLLNKDFGFNTEKATHIEIKDNKINKFYSKITEIREILNNGWIGYNATYKIKKGDLVATFECGYINGLDRILSNKNFFVFIKTNNGKYIKCKLIGLISMDQATIQICKKFKNDIQISNRIIIIDNDFTNFNVNRFINKTINCKTLFSLSYNKNRNEIKKIS